MAKMGQYRVEISPNNRAGCQDPVCKASQTKLLKGEIRFGSWKEINEHGSWSWKHWGCVSGAQVGNLQDACDKGDGDYDFDRIDGFDELNDHPEIQDKIRRCVKQGHIDPEDFKGDPEKNVPGAKGIHLTAKQRAAKEAATKGGESEEDPAKKPTPAKKTRKKASVEDDDDEQPAAKKAKTSKAAKSTKTAESAKSKASGSAQDKLSAKKAAVQDEETEDVDATEDEARLVKKPRKSTAKVAKTAKSRGRVASTIDGPDNQSRRITKSAMNQSSDEEGEKDDHEDAVPMNKGKRGAKSKASASEPAKARRGRPRKAQ